MRGPPPNGPTIATATATAGCLAAAALALAACSAEPVTIETAANCDQLADASIDVMQAILDQLAGLQVADAVTLADSPAIQELQEQATLVEQHAGELECDPAEQDRRMQDRFDRLSAEGPVAEFILESFRDR